jgi:hypothetical protein
MLDLNYVSEVIFKQTEVSLSWHRRINQVLSFAGTDLGRQ